MPEIKQRIAFLVVKLHKEGLTDSEKQELLDWASESDQHFAFYKELTETESFQEEIIGSTRSLDKIWDRIEEKIKHPKLVRLKTSRIWWRYASVAAIFVLIFSLFYLRQANTSKHLLRANQPKDLTIAAPILPGGNHATLRLGDGTSIQLDNSANGIIARQDNTSIQKKENGLLSYEVNGNSTSTGIAFNTISTPRGGQYHVILPDKSEAWLNSESSIRFPTAFTGDDRRIEMSGEVYFEVSHDASKPFHVNMNGMDVSVLGTHFCVNGYSDELVIKTTLLQGKVKVTNGDKVVMLSPGEQSRLDRSGVLKQVKNIETQNEIAWLHGIIHFDNANVNTVMRQLARWYDVNVEYVGTISQQNLQGDLQRNIPLLNVLQQLEKITDDIHFQVDEKTKTVKVIGSNK